MGIFDELKKRYSQRINEAKSAVNFVRQAPDNIRVGMNVGRNPNQSITTRSAQGFLHGTGKFLGDTANLAIKIQSSRPANILNPSTLMLRKNQPRIQTEINQFRSNLNKVAPTTNAGKVGSFIGENLPAVALPASKGISAARIASPLKRLAANTLLRGAENAGINTAFRTARDQKTTLKDVRNDVLVGGAFNVVMSPKQVINSAKYASALRKMDRAIPSKYSKIQETGNLYKPNVREEVVPISQFEQEITGNKNRVNFMGEKGVVTKKIDKQTGKLISWETNSPEFAKRMQEGNIQFGLSTRNVKPSEGDPLSNEARKILNDPDIKKEYDFFSGSDYFKNNDNVISTLSELGDENTTTYKALDLIRQERGLGSIYKDATATQKQIESKITKKDLSGFTNEKSQLQIGRIEKTLDSQIRYNGKVMAKRDYIKQLLNDGYVVDEKLNKLKKGNGNYYDVSKTEADYARHLSNQSLSTTPKTRQGKVEPPMGGTPEMPKKPQGKERGFSKTFAKTENLPEELQGKKLTYNPITNEETLKTAQTQLDVEKFVKSNYDQAKKRVMSGEMTPENNMLSQELIRRNIAEGKFDEVDEIFNKLAEKGTTGGQFIQSFAAWSKTTPEGMLKYAKSTVDKANSELGSISKGIRGVFGKGTPKIDESDAKFITDAMKKAQGLPEAEKLPLIQSVFDRINKKIPWGVSDVLDTYRYNNMLSNPLTHLRNAVSNIVQTSITRPATLLAQGKGKQALQYEMGTLKALPDAVDGFIKAMKKPGQLGRLDEPMKLKPRLLGRWNTPSDLMEAGDVFFRKLIESGETARGATKADAARIGEYSLFRAPLNDKQQGALLNKIDDVTKATYNLRKVGLGWFIPFIRTPMNVAKQWVEYSPAGFSTMVGASNKGEQAAKAVIGSLITMAGANLALQGRTTWDAPTDPKEKELFYASGRKPFSVKIKDKWVPMQTFGAYAFALGLPAAAKYYQTESRTALTDDDISKWAKIATSGLNFWSGQTFVSGLGNFVDLVQGDQDWKLSRVVAQPLTQLKPMTGALSYISRLVDPVFRKASGFTDQLKSGVPGLTKGMEAYTNPFGEESRRNITDFVAPYSMGQADPRFEQQLKDRTKTLQENNLINMMKKGKDVEVKTGQLSDGLYQRSNGKVYSQKLDKEFDTRDEADQAVAKEDFKKSGANFKDMGKYVLRKKEDGEPQVMPKGEYMFKINNVKLENAKKSKNLKEWNKLAQKKLGYLTYKLNDPSVDELDKLEFQKDIDALSIEMIKFGAYGGFTKPKKAKKAKQLKLATSAIRPPSLPSLRSSVSSVNIPKLSISKIGGGSVQTGRPRSLRTKRYAA
jgi:hypothetical protein